MMNIINVNLQIASSYGMLCIAKWLPCLRRQVNVDPFLNISAREWLMPGSILCETYKTTN